MGQGFWDNPPRHHLVLRRRLLESKPFRSGAPLRLLEAREFPKNSWDADLRSLLVLADYAATDWRERIKLNPPPANDSDQTRREIEELIQLANTERPGAADEIAEQDTGFPQYFLHLLMMSSQSHPATYLVIKIAARVAEISMVHFKAKYNRCRPSQLYPALLPEVNIATHPAYPSGHSMMAHMFAHCASEVLPHMRPALMELAAQIGRNREVAGLHYSSDTNAGELVAQQAAEILQQLDSYQDAIKAAKAEWG